MAQLIGKISRCNLSARRHSRGEIAHLMDDPDAMVVPFRLLDRFGDNGVVAVFTGRAIADGARRSTVG